MGSAVFAAGIAGAGLVDVVGEAVVAGIDGAFEWADAVVVVVVVVVVVDVEDVLNCLDINKFDDFSY